MQFFFGGRGGGIRGKCLVLFWDWPPCGFPVTSDLTPNTPVSSVGSSCSSRSRPGEDPPAEPPGPFFRFSGPACSFLFLFSFLFFGEVKTVVVGISFVQAAGRAQRWVRGSGTVWAPQPSSQTCLLVCDYFDRRWLWIPHCVQSPDCSIPSLPKVAPPADNTLDTCIYVWFVFPTRFPFQIVVSIVLTLEYLLLAFSSHINLITWWWVVLLPRMIVYNFIPFISGYSVNIVIHCLFLTW